MSGGSLRLGMLAGLAAAALLLPAPAAAPAGTGSSSELERSVLAEVNAVRRSHGLVPLRTSVRLTLAAAAHSNAMARLGFFAHPSRDGTAFWKRIERYYPSNSYEYWAVGENLLWSSGNLGAARAVEMWMNSPAHREVLLTPRWREIGLSAIRASSAPGAFGGRDVTILTADFGIRR